jgi:hypothetical protein
VDKFSKKLVQLGGKIIMPKTEIPNMGHHTYVERIRSIASEIERITKVGGYVYVEVPTYEKALRQKLEGGLSEEPGDGTFVPSEGDEAGIPHHHCTRDELLKFFSNITIRTVHESDEHYCLTGIRN